MLFVDRTTDINIIVDDALAKLENIKANVKMLKKSNYDIIKVLQDILAELEKLNLP